MGTFTMLPVSDMKNRGWTLVGGESTLYATWNNDNDGKYASSPVGFHPTTPIAAAQGIAEILFERDTDDLPEGAVVTSVTASLRMNKTVASTKMVNLCLVTADEETKFLSRAEFTNSSITTHDVLTTTVDALDEVWDVHRLNSALVRIYCHNSLAADEVRVYKVFLTVNYSVAPSVTIVSPSGTEYSATPEVNWDYTNSEGVPDESAEYKVFHAADTTAVSFNPDLDTPVYENTVDGGLYTFRIGDSLPTGNYVLYMRATSVHGATSAWATKEFEISAPFPAIPGNDTNGSLGSAPITVADADLSAVNVTVRDASNLLSMQQADFDLTDDYLGYTATSCVLTRDTTVFYTRGRGSMKVFCTAAPATATSTFVEVASSTPFTIRAQVLSAVTARTATLSVQFYTSAFVATGSAVSANVTDSATTWKEIVATGTSPSDAAFFKLSISFAGVAASEVHYVDRVGFMYGTNSAWSSGGHLSRNLLSSFVATGDASAGSATHFITDNAATTLNRVAATGTGSDGGTMYQMTYTGASPSIAWRGKGAEYTRTTSSNAYTLNTPAAAVDEDLMVAFVSVDADTTINVPEGWEYVNGVGLGGGGANKMFILKRTFVTGDASSWSGTLGGVSTNCYAIVVAYSGAAPASQQFLADSVRQMWTDVVHESASVTNTMSNAWRLSAFTFRDDAAGSIVKVNKDSATTPPAIQYVGKGATWSGVGAEFTLHRPSGVADDDLMIAYVGFIGAVTVTSAPNGWTPVKTTTIPFVPGDYPTQRSQMDELTYIIYKRTATATEQASWTGTLSVGSAAMISGTVAYRNAKDISAQFLSDGGDFGVSQTISGTSVTTASLTNTNSRSWVVSALLTGRVANPDVAYDTESDMGPRRSSAFTTTVGDTHDISLTFWDTDSQVSTGAFTHILESTTTQLYMGGFVGIIAPLDIIPPAGADETERNDANVASILHQGIYDSAAGVPTGITKVYGEFSNSTPVSSTSWIGLIRPADASPEGLVESKMEDLVDISQVDPWIYTLADNKMTVVGSFIGSAAGAPLLSLEFYRANRLLNSYTAEGSAFGTSIWTKSSATFEIPAGTTHVRMKVSATDRAVNDTVSFDRLSIAFGESSGWRNGTMADEHPIWSIPHIQYSEDDGNGYSDWADVPGLQVNPPEYDPLTGLVTFTDHTAVPLRDRKYRIKTVTYGLQGDKFVSAYGPESDPVTFSAQSGAWWLKDLLYPDNSLEMDVKADPTNISKKGTTAVFHPLGEDYAVPVSDGYKGDEFEITVVCNSSQWVLLKELVTSERSLFLKSDVDEAWWIRPVGDLRSQILVTGSRQSEPIRFVTLQYVQVKAEL